LAYDIYDHLIDISTRLQGLLKDNVGRALLLIVVIVD